MYVTTVWLFACQITNTAAGSPRTGCAISNGRDDIAALTGQGRFFISFMGFIFVVCVSAYTGLHILKAPRF